MHISDAAFNSYVLLAIAIVLIIAAAYLKSITCCLIPPIYQKKHLFSEAEKRFFRTLEYAVRDEKVKVLAKVRLADIFSVGEGTENTIGGIFPGYRRSTWTSFWSMRFLWSLLWALNLMILPT